MRYGYMFRDVTGGYMSNVAGVIKRNIWVRVAVLLVILMSVLIPLMGYTVFTPRERDWVLLKLAGYLGNLVGALLVFSPGILLGAMTGFLFYDRFIWLSSTAVFCALIGILLFIPTLS